MGVSNGQGPSEFWTDWLGFMADAVGTEDPRYVWWKNLVCHSYEIYPTTIDDFCAAGPYSFPPLTSESFETIGATQILVQWMQDYCYSAWCQGENGGGGDPGGGGAAS